jgi:hypothetical protein
MFATESIRAELKSTAESSGVNAVGVSFAE